MARSQRKTTVAILRGVLGPIHGQEGRFAKLARRSPSWVKKVSAGVTALNEETAYVLEHETGVSSGWLLGSAKVPPVDIRGAAYTFEDFKWYRAKVKEGDRPKKTLFTLREFVPQIVAIGAAAGERGDVSLFLVRLKKFVEESAAEFGMNSGAKNAMVELLAKSDLGNMKIHDKGFDLSLITEERVGGKLRAFLAAQPKPIPEQKFTLNYSERLPQKASGNSHRKDVRGAGRANRPK